MNVPGKQYFLALDEELEAKGRALRERLESHTDLSEPKDDLAALNELLQARVFIKAILDNLDGGGV